MQTVQSLLGLGDIHQHTVDVFNAVLLGHQVALVQNPDDLAVLAQQAVFQLDAAAAGKLLGHLAADHLAVLREDQIHQAALELDAQLLLRISQQGRKRCDVAVQGEPKIVAAAVDTRQELVDIVFGKTAFFRAQGGGRLGQGMADQHDPAAVGIQRLNAQKGTFIPLTLLGGGVIELVVLGQLAKLTLHQSMYMVCKPLGKGVQLLRRSQLADQGTKASGKSVLRGEEIKAGIGIVHQMVEVVVQVDFQNGGVEVVQQSMVLQLHALQRVKSLLGRGAGKGRGDLIRGRSTVLVGTGDLRELVADVLKAFQKLGGENAAVTVEDHAHGKAMGVSLLIDLLAGQGVVDVRKTHHLGADGDVVPLEAFGIAVAVPALVVVVTDVMGVTQVLGICDVVHPLQDAAARKRMGLHHGHFFGGKALWLMEDGIRHGDLTYIVKGGGADDQRDDGGGQIVFRAAHGHIFQQELGEAAHPLDVLAGFRAAVFDDGGQAVYHDLVGMLGDLGLLFQHLLQPPALAVQGNYVFHTPLDHMEVIGRDDDVGYTHIEQTGFQLIGAFVRDDDDRQLRQKLFPGHFPEDLIAAFDRHQGIQDHCGDTAVVFLHQQKGLFAVFGFQQVIVFFKGSLQGVSAGCVVIDQQQRVTNGHLRASFQGYIINTLL